MYQDNIRKRVASLLAMEQLSESEIAEQFRLNRRTLTRWKKQPEFQELVQSFARAQRQQLESKGIAKLRGRIRVANKQWLDLTAFMERRGRDPRMRSVPGGRSGLLVRRTKVLRSGDNFGLLVDYRLDEKLLRTLRGLERWVSEQLGQWDQPDTDSAQRSDPDSSAARHFTGPQEKAALLIAQGSFSFQQVAESCHVDRRTLNRWRQSPEFQALIAEYRTRLAQSSNRYPITDKAHRLAAVNERWLRLKRVIDERGASPEYRRAPGGRTGFLRMERRVLPFTGGPLVTVDFPTDGALIRESLAHHAQVARELGQWDMGHKTRRR